MVTAARYQIVIPYFSAYRKAIKEFADAGSVMIDKLNKRTGNTVTVNIKPQIVSISIDRADKKNIVLLATLHSTLNPEVMLKSFYNSVGKLYNRLAVRVERTSILCSYHEELTPLEYVLTESQS
jgi:hypothetical protein